ncbi:MULTISPECIES: nuclear transport factor 2 family protein [unclassified Mycobacterium]|uniref:nuclear transport factor 2 family protein n=1 Tax=unclassified Mycobacterium TaxID=2642494 RepID=UPI0029C7BD24|nr:MULTISPECIES: nuclear transport factor 2 family protein [unclassified Mycobacterium]
MDNEQLVRQFVELLSSEDNDALRALLDDDVVVHYGSEAPVSGSAEFLSLLRDGGRTILHRLPGLFVTVEAIVAERDRVGFRYLVRRRSQDSPENIAAGGAAICQITGDRIKQLWVVTDRSALERQVAALNA